MALLAGIGAPPSAMIGVRHALEHGRGRTAVPVGPALLGSTLAVTALCATVVFGASLTHLISTPALYGQPFELEFTPFGPAACARALDGRAAPRPRHLRHHPGGVGDDAVTINGRTVKAVAGQSLRGPLLFTAISGHLPAAADQVALGTTTLRQLGVHVGSPVRVTAPAPGRGPHRLVPGSRHHRVPA